MGVLIEALAIIFNCSASCQTSIIDSLNNYRSMAKNYENLAKYDSALKYFEYYSLLAKKSGLIDNYIIGRVYGGRISLAQRLFPQAEQHINEAISLTNDFQAKKNVVAFAYQAKGDLLLSMGKYENSQLFFQRALDLRVSFYGETDIRVARTLSSLATNYSRIGRFEESVALFRQAASIITSEMDNDNSLIAVLVNMAEPLYEVGRFQDANKSLEEALKLLQDSRVKNEKQSIEIFIALARVKIPLGDYTHAIILCNRALNLIGSSNDYDNIQRAYCYQYLGIINKILLRYNSAESNFHKSIEFVKEGQFNSHFLATNYLHLGELQYLNGNYDKAIRNFSAAESAIDGSSKKDRKLQILILKHMGRSIAKKEQYHDALHTINKAITVAREYLGETHWDVKECYEVLASILRSQKAYNKSVYLYNQVLAGSQIDTCYTTVFAKQALSENGIDRIEYLIPLQGKANAMAEWAVLQRKGVVVDDSSGLTYIDKLEIAVDTYELGVALIDKMRNSYRGDLSKQALGERGFNVYEGGIHATQLLAKATGDDKYLEKAFWFAQKGQANILADALKEAKARRFAGISDSLLKQEHELRTTLTYYETQQQKELEKGSDADSLRLSNLQNKVFDYKISYDSLITQLENDYPQYYDLKYRNEVSSLNDLRTALGSDDACLNFVVGDSSIYTFAITNEEFVIHQQKRDGTLQRDVRRFRASLMPDTSTGELLSSSHDLYRRLILPVKEIIATKANLLIIPDGPLLQIPFEALLTTPVAYATGDKPDFRKLPYFLHDHKISYHYSASLFVSTMHQVSQQMPKRAFGGFAPVFDKKGQNGYIVSSGNAGGLASLSEMWTMLTRDGRNFNQLPNSRREVKQILKMFENDAAKSDAFVYRMASEEAFKTHAGQYQFLHLATHGFTNAEKPQLSGIAFSQPKDSTEAEDGILYAGEVYNLELNADLVVLSSCESGIGKLVKGEGMMAMTRGFLYAGASNVAVSLWKVIDRHTSELMVNFYQNIRSGRAYRPALHDAKLRLVNNRFTAHPRSWSSFVLIGQ